LDEQLQNESLFSKIKRTLSGRRRALTEKELQEAINSSEEQGILNESEGDMLQSIFEFGDTLVREVMVPRTDMVCCSIDAGLDELRSLILRTGHSRIPIFESSLDRIVGVIYAKDLLRYWCVEDRDFPLSEAMRQPFFIPETQRIEVLLNVFRVERVHIAIVVEEYGGTSGLITIEDLLEEIVGEIRDEYDNEEDLAELQKDGSLLIDGRANVEELEEVFDIEVPRDKFDTVGGYLFHLMGKVPAAGEKIIDNGLLLQVVESDERRIRKVRVRRIEETEDQEGTPE
jgi:magnesium and cobalt transporter